MARKIPSVEEIREWHQAEADSISDAIRRGKTDHLRASEGVFAKSFASLTPEDRRNRAKTRLRKLNEKHAAAGMEP